LVSVIWFYLSLRFSFFLTAHTLPHARVPVQILFAIWVVLTPFYISPFSVHLFSRANALNFAGVFLFTP
jgi:hypothetical protein